MAAIIPDFIAEHYRSKVTAFIDTTVDEVHCSLTYAKTTATAWPVIKDLIVHLKSFMLILSKYTRRLQYYHCYVRAIYGRSSVHLVDVQKWYIH